MTVIATLLAAATLGLGDFTADARAQLESRIRNALGADGRECSVEGAVTGVSDSGFFIQQGDDALKVAYEGGAFPKPGDVVRVDGTPSLEGGRVLISAKKWTKTGTSPLPAPRPAGYAELVNPGDAAHGQQGVNWMRVEVEGRAIERTSNGFAIDADGLPITVLTPSVSGFVAPTQVTVGDTLEAQGALTANGMVSAANLTVSGVFELKQNGFFDWDKAGTLKVPDGVYAADLENARLVKINSTSSYAFTNDAKKNALVSLVTPSHGGGRVQVQVEVKGSASTKTADWAALGTDSTSKAGIVFTTLTPLAANNKLTSAGGALTRYSKELSK